MSSSITDPEISAPPARPRTLPAAPPDDTTPLRKQKGGRTLAGLTTWQLVLASVTLFLWLNLFAGGMLVDTRPYRCAISWAGVETVIPATFKDHPCQAYWPAREGVRVFNRYGLPGVAVDEQTAQLPVQPPPLGDGAKAWLMALIFYTPLNLAFISATAGALGSLGSIANLNTDSDTSADAGRDRTNPLISGLLRGMFVYLFMISGMLLFDDSPFSATSPDQYVRLAGFLSLFSFVVNYQPSVFSTLIDWANTRIQTRNTAGITRGTKGEVEMKVPAGGEAKLINRTVSETRAVAQRQLQRQRAGRLRRVRPRASHARPVAKHRLTIRRGAQRESSAAPLARFRAAAG